MEHSPVSDNPQIGNLIIFKDISVIFERILYTKKRSYPVWKNETAYVLNGLLIHVFDALLYKFMEKDVLFLKQYKLSGSVKLHIGDSWPAERSPRINVLSIAMLKCWNQT